MLNVQKTWIYHIYPHLINIPEHSTCPSKFQVMFPMKKPVKEVINLEKKYSFQTNFPRIMLHVQFVRYPGLEQGKSGKHFADCCYFAHTWHTQTLVENKSPTHNNRNEPDTCRVILHQLKIPHSDAETGKSQTVTIFGVLFVPWEGRSGQGPGKHQTS